VHDISIKKNVGYEAIMGIIDRYVECRLSLGKIAPANVIVSTRYRLKKGTP